jgi:excisionase family DNA binding protein
MRKSMLTAATGEFHASSDSEALVQDGLMTIGEAQQFLRLGRSTLYALMDRRELPYVMLGRARRIPKRALIAYAAKSVRGDTATSKTAIRETSGVFPKHGGER